MPALDGLRGLAVLMVVLTHAAFLTGTGASAGLPGHLLARGDFGVSLFFALSGFLLYRLLADELDRSGRLRLSRYAARRFARVVPAYWLVLAVLMVALHVSARDGLLHALGLQIYVADSVVKAFGQSWSVATELSFYAVLPLAVLGLARAARRRPGLPMATLLAALIVTSSLGLLVGPAFIGSDVILERLLPWRAPHFLVGMILAEATRQPGLGASAWLRRRADDVGGTLAVAGAAYLAATTPLAGSLLLEPAHGIPLVLRTALATIFAAGLLLPVALGSTSAWSRLLARPTIRWLGVVSYGVFLWHLPVFEGLFQVTGAPFFRGGLLALLAVGLPVSVLLGFVSHRFVELPSSRLASRLTRGERQRQRRDERDPDSTFEPGRTERGRRNDRLDHG